MAHQFFPTAEGFYDYVNSKYIYQYKDHLDKREQSATLGEDWERSSVKISYNNSNNVTEIIDKNYYCPFGMSTIYSKYPDFQ